MTEKPTRYKMLGEPIEAEVNGVNVEDIVKNFCNRERAHEKELFQEVKNNFVKIHMYCGGRNQLYHKIKKDCEGFDLSRILELQKAYIILFQHGCL